MAELVGGLIAANGERLAVHLSPVIEAPSGEQSGLLAGSDLFARSWGVRNASPHAIRVSA